MGSLRTLSILNWVMAGMYVLVGGFMLLMLDSIGSHLGAKGGAEASEMLLFIGLVGGGVIGLFAILHGWAAVSVAEGRGRVIQTILGVLQVGNFPIGSAYAVYGFWVCFVSPISATAFANPREEDEPEDDWAHRVQTAARAGREPGARRQLRDEEPAGGYDEERRDDEEAHADEGAGGYDDGASTERTPAPRRRGRR